MVKETSLLDRDYNARFTATHRTVSVYRVLQMRGEGYADVLPTQTGDEHHNTSRRHTVAILLMADKRHLMDL